MRHLEKRIYRLFFGIGVLLFQSACGMTIYSDGTAYSEDETIPDPTISEPPTDDTSVTGSPNEAPFDPLQLSCPAAPNPLVTASCTLVAASPLDPEGDVITYQDADSTCVGTVIDPFTGSFTFTTPTAGNSCSIRVRAYDGRLTSGVVSASITAVNQAPSAPAAVTCASSIVAGSLNQTCSLTASSPADPDGDNVTYLDAGSTCSAVSVNATTGVATFTAPAKGASCLILVKANDGIEDSAATSSAAITGTNNPPAIPASLSCPSATAGSTGNPCTLTAATPPDADGDSVTYDDGGSTCASVIVNSTTGNATFSAPASGSSCTVRVRAYDGSAYSTNSVLETVGGINTVPAVPASLACTTSPLGGATAQTCTLTAAATPDADGDSVTYADASSTCASPSVDSTTGAATFTAPAKGATCVMKVRAYDGADYSSAVSSATITGANNAPAAPASLTCTTSPLGGATAQTCTLTAAATLDADGDSVTYADAASTCASPSFNSSTGAATFTAPAKGATCLMKVKANDGTADSSVTTSATITGQNNAPNPPASVSCPTTPVGGSTGNACTLTAAATLDIDGDAITYTDDGSTCPAFSINSSTGAATFTAPAVDTTCVLKIRTFDGTAYSSSTSSATLTGTVAPLSAATGLGWSQSSPTSLTNVTAAWTVSNSAGTTGQKIQYYTGASCNTVSGSLTDLASAATATHSFTGSSGTIYSYKITTTDAQGSIESACSSALVIDTCVQGVSSLDMGDNFSCVKVGDALKCWGDNNSGQLGDGTTTARYSPVSVTGVDSAIATFRARKSHTCAIMNGALKCWGSNASGQLGDGTTTYRTTPVAVSGMDSQVDLVDIGHSHTCAVASGALKCWGYNDGGRLGDGTTTNRLTPTTVSGMGSGVTAVGAGWTHNCAVVNGALKCWGYNVTGQLGSGTTTSRITPVAVSGMGSGVTAVGSGDEYSCAIMSGALKCWGTNLWGRLGDGTTTNRYTPTNVSGMGSGVTQMSAGWTYACALVSGALKCWGDNYLGTIGDGTTIDRLTPVKVSGMSSGVTEVKAASGHTCAIVSGVPKCWGSNTVGRLGDGTTTARRTPTTVSGFPFTPGVAAKLAFSSSSPNSSQGLGEEFSIQPRVEVQDACGNLLFNSSASVSLGASSDSSCANTAAGTLNVTTNPLTATSGKANFGGVSYSHSSSDSIYLNATVSGLAPACSASPVSLFAASTGATSLGWSQSSPQTGSATASWTISSDGNIASQKIALYEGPNCDVTMEAPIMLASPATSTFAFSAGEGVYTYKIISINTNGVETYSSCSSAMEMDLTPPSYDPVFLSTDPTNPNASTSPLVIGLASPDSATVTIYSDSSCVTEIGTGSKTTFEGAGIAASVSSSSFTHIYARAFDLAGNGSSCVPFTTYYSSSSCSAGPTSIATASDHSCAVDGGSLQCWGTNTYGRLGDGTSSDRSSPVSVSGMSSGVSLVDTGGYHSCAIMSGALKCWGRNQYGYLGDATTTTRLTPVSVSGMSSGVTAVSLGFEHTCAIVNGALRCWGINTSGRLGDGTTSTRYTPVVVSGMSAGVTAVSLGSLHTCAIVSGALRCWGSNSNGRLGDNTTTNRFTPTLVSGMGSGVTAVAGAGSHTCAIVSGALRCWGYGVSGRLGDSASTDRRTPVAVSGMASGVTKVTAGTAHTCALQDGALKCWGSNTQGQIGDGSTIARTTPTSIYGLTSGVSSISGKGTQSCATVNGLMKCWGANTSGQLGDGTTTRRLHPSVATINGASGVATQITFTGQPLTGNAGVAFPLQPEVTLKDACGNIAAAASNSITLSAATNSDCSTTAGGSIGGTNPVAAQSGTVSFTGINYSTNATIYLKAAGTDLTDACSASTVVVSP